MHRTQIYITEQQHGLLSTLAAREGVSISEKIREFIDEQLKQRTNLDNDPLFSLGRDGLKLGNPQASEDHDAAIYGQYDGDAE